MLTVVDISRYAIYPQEGIPKGSLVIIIAPACTKNICNR